MLLASEDSLRSCRLMPAWLSRDRVGRSHAPLPAADSAQRFGVVAACAVPDAGIMHNGVARAGFLAHLSSTGYRLVRG